MKRGGVRYLVGSVVLALLSGCGLFRTEQRAPWRDEAERACLASKAVVITPFVESGREIDGPGACGMQHPFKVSAFADGSVGLTSRATLACPIVPRIDGWIEEVVQPAAEIYLGQRVVELRAGSYSCRGMNNQRSAPLSEHAFGNAVDVMAFRLADGRELTVASAWRGSDADQSFLREVFLGACRMFSTVLAPGSDPFHDNHLHLDLARHHGGRVICKPVIKFAPRLGDGQSWPPAGGPMSPRPAGQPASREGYDSDALEELIEDSGEPAVAAPRR